MKFLEKIYKAIDQDSLGVFVGAGLSVGAGLPSWEDLLGELIDKVENETQTAEDRIKDLRALNKNPTKYLLLAEELREILSDTLDVFIREKFDDKNIRPTKAHELAVSLPAQFLITTNYDTLLEKAFVKVHDSIFPSIFSYDQPDTINYNLWNNEYFILKAHGDAKNSPKNIILTEKDYRKVIHQSYGYQSVLHTIFSSCTILFIGASLSDPELLLLLGFIHNIFHGGSPHHYALLAEDKVTKTEVDRWRKDFNIHIITYNPKNNHEEVENIMKTIIDKKGVVQF